jgi:pimeloyl-ACP methyl ester carboxylesterase
MKTTLFEKHKISFSDEGKGKTIVLLHGFTESGRIWNDFAKKLSKEFRVIIIDLPGHGKSAGLGPVHTMELQAEVVHHVLKTRKVKKCLMIGHSMGGYVTLSFAGKYPEMLRGFCLFHSHAYADSQQDKENRDRTIQLVRKDKFHFITQFIKSLFPPESLEKFSAEIRELITRSEKLEKENIIAALEGMKERYDQTMLLKTTDIPVLFILGLKDSKAPLPRLWEMITLPRYSESLILRDAGHMGYIEEPEKTLAALRGFAYKVLKGSK